MLKVDWPEQDLKAIQRSIHRAQNEFGKSLKESVTWAGIFLAKSAGAATDKAPNKRKAYVNRGKDEQWSKAQWPYYRIVWTGALGNGKGPDNTFRWYLKDKTEEKYREIKRAGLAKKSWKWMLPGIKYGGGGNFAQEVEKREQRFDFEIEMSNKLPYIRKALKTDDNGDYLLKQALGKAASRMEKTIYRRSKRMAR